MNEWYILRVITGKENEVAARIEARGFAKTLVPIRSLFERLRGKWQYVLRIMFPGYVFVYLDLSPQLYYDILDVPHAIRFLGSPDAVPNDQMQVVQMLNAGAPLDMIRKHIVRVDKRRRRATLEIGLLDETRHVDIGIEDTSSLS